MVKCAQGNMSGAGRGGYFFVLYCRKALWPASLRSHNSPYLCITLCFGFATSCCWTVNQASDINGCNNCVKTWCETETNNLDKGLVTGIQT